VSAAPEAADIAARADGFIARWRGATATEPSTAQSFLIELRESLDVPCPVSDAGMPTA
jgi:hypothetical protein